MDLFAGSSAVISECGLYRLRLDRTIAEHGIVAAIIGVNPSTADAEKNDATIRKDMGFGRRLGWRKIIKGNKFGYRATDVTELRLAADPVGPDNDLYLEQIMREADIVVAAWGPLSKLPPKPRFRDRWKIVAGIAARVGKPLMCFGTAMDGQPRHTLMLAYETPLTPWTSPWTHPSRQVARAPLKKFGYAPGNYLFRCLDCTDEQNDNRFRFADKLAWRCEGHALAKAAEEK